jgi:hypothetical protein
MAVTRTTADEYRRRARQCLSVARTLPPGSKRTVLIDAAQSYLQLAEQEAPPVPDRPVVQQQQQARPKDESDKTE